MHDTASDFVSALVDGRHADAVALSDAGVNDFACSWLVADRRLGAWFNASVESVSVDEGGAQAQAQVTTQAVDGTEDEMSFDLVRGETEWKVVLPESYRIEASFAGPAVVQMQLLDHSLVDFDSPQDIQDCVIKAQGGIMSTKALPGNYAVAFVDPTGVVDYR